VVAFAGAAATTAPALLVVVLIAELGLASRALAVWLAAGIVALGLVRAFLEHRRARKRLLAFAIDTEEDGLILSGASGTTRVPSGSITFVSEIDGAFGGLRVDLSGPGLPPRFDVPLGGEAFADLRAWLVARAPLRRALRRSRAIRVALTGALVLGLFFVPFVVADARGSRLAGALVLFVAWVAMRAAARA
jgi:hypothetical protein